MLKLLQHPWSFIGNSWQYTTIYDANETPVCQLDLEDWGVTEDNQEDLEAKQEEVARLIAAAPELLSSLKETGRIARSYEETLLLLRRQLIEAGKADMTGIIDSTLGINVSDGKSRLDRALGNTIAKATQKAA